MTSDFDVELLSRKHDRRNFDCGEDSLNVFLKNYARQNDEKGLGKTFVAANHGDNVVCGYYTLSSASVSFDTVPERLPRYPIPTVHLGRLAVDNKSKGLGLGEFLLMDAIRRSIAVANEIGLYAMELYAISTTAKSFYLKYGFLELKDDDRHLYLPMATLRKLGLA